jgi:hypothetical protein
LQVLVQLDAVEDHVDAGLHPRAQDSQCGKTDATRSACPCGGSMVGSCFAFDDVGPVAKGPVEFDHLVRVGALLRCVDARRTKRTV